MGIIVGFALYFQRIKDTNLTLDSHFFLPLFLRRTHVIYNWLHADKRSRGDLYSYCRHGLKYRRKRLSDPRNSKKRGRYKSILDRPEIIDVQGRMGDMEMDLILGASSSSEAILTLTDRKTDYIFLKALPHRRKTKPIARAVNSRLALLKRRGQLLSITTDNGPEFSAFRSIERGLGVPVYFARPYRSTNKPHITRQCFNPAVPA